MGLRVIDTCEVFVSIWASYPLPGSGRASGVAAWTWSSGRVRDTTFVPTLRKPSCTQRGHRCLQSFLSFSWLPLPSPPTATWASEVVLLRQDFALHCSMILQTLGVRPGTQTGVYMQGEHLCESRAKDTLEHQAQVLELALRQGTWTF